MSFPCQPTKSGVAKLTIPVVSDDLQCLLRSENINCGKYKESSVCKSFNTFSEARAPAKVTLVQDEVT